MTKADARAAIDRSLARGSATPATWVEDRRTYIEERSAELQAALIEPIRVFVVGESFSYGVKKQLDGTELFAIARRDDHWLLYSPQFELFSLAFGADEKDLSIVGFASDDALAEWLG